MLKFESAIDDFIEQCSIFIVWFLKLNCVRHFCRKVSQSDGEKETQREGDATAGLQKAIISYSTFVAFIWTKLEVLKEGEFAFLRTFFLYSLDFLFIFRKIQKMVLFVSNLIVIAPYTPLTLFHSLLLFWSHFIASIKIHFFQ